MKAQDEVNLHEPYPDPHHTMYSKTIFGFWLYILSDFMLFATLFATYLVLAPSTFGGPSAKELFHLPFGMVLSFLLLASSYTSGLGTASAHRKDQKWTLIFYGITFLLGLLFFSMELTQFIEMIKSGNSWTKSGFLSAFFNLAGMHMLHLFFALVWIPILLIPVWRSGITSQSLIRLACLKMFWQFLNVVWIFIFTALYIVGSNV